MSELINNMPLVSIVVPSYNVEDHIDEFIESIIGQTYKNWEMIIVDDGSTDKTVSRIMAFLTDSRIILLHRDRTPKGSVTCRNIGQEIAKGKYIIHFDADDIVKDYCLEQRVDFMEKHPDVDYATFTAQVFWVKDEKNVLRPLFKGVNPNKDLLSEFLSVNYAFSVWNNIYVASVFKDYLWDEKVKIYTDFSYIVPAIILGYNHAFADGYPVDYLYRTGQKKAMTSNFIADDKYNSTKYLFSKIQYLIKGIDNSKIYKKAFKKFYYLQMERVFLNGSYEQIIDFYNYFTAEYKKELRLNLVYKLLLPKAKQDRDEKYQMYAKFITYLLFEPNKIFSWVYSKISHSGATQ